MGEEWDSTDDFILSISPLFIILLIIYYITRDNATPLGITVGTIAISLICFLWGISLFISTVLPSGIYS